MSGDVLEEFARGELERNVGLAIGVDADQVEYRIGGPQGVAPIGDDDVDVFSSSKAKYSRATSLISGSISTPVIGIGP